jgi:hypothetical protein
MNPAQQGALLLLLSLLICGAQASTYTYTIPYNGAQMDPNIYYSGGYQLGTLSVNNSVTLSFELPNAAISAGFSTIVSMLQLLYLDPITKTYLPAITASGAAFTVVPPAMGKTTYSITYAVGFPPVVAPATPLTSASFILKSNADALMMNYFDYFYLTVTYFPSNQPITASNANSVQTILKITDISRSDLVKVVYLAQPNQYINFTLSPGVTCTMPGVCMAFATSQIRTLAIPDFATKGFSGN